MFAVQTIVLPDYRSDSAGCNSAFWFVRWAGQKAGLKTYRDASFAVEFLAVQNLLAAHGLAPKVLSGLVEVVEYAGQRPERWGYVTALASPDLKRFRNSRSELKRVKQGVIDALGLRHNASIRDYFWDDHGGNFGFAEDKMLMIDMDDAMWLRRKAKDEGYRVR